MLLSLYRLARKAKKYVMSMDNTKAYFQILALECAFIGYLAAGTFINRFRAEILYWMILFLAVAIKVYYLQAKKANAGAAGEGDAASYERAKFTRKSRDVYT